MARRKRAVQKDDEQEQATAMFPNLPTSDDDQEPEAEAETEDYGSVIAELRKQIEDQNRQIEESRRSTLAIMSQPATVVPPQPPKATGELPSPIDDPDGYAQAIRDQIEGEYRYKQDLQAFQQTQAQQDSAKLANLWNNFQEAYPEYAENQRQVEIATMEVVNKAKASGLDVNKYMYGNSPLFMKDVIKEIDGLFGSKGSANDDDDDGEDDDRTGGMLGGGGKPAAGGKPKSKMEPLGSLTADIQAFQQKTGYRA